jgi:8-oxo-dGTP diphosphatase
MRHRGRPTAPGGKLEPGESDLDAARREMREELDLDVTAVGRERLAVHDPGSPFLIAFIDVAVQGTPTCHEHMELRWCTPAELQLLPLAPSDGRFVAEVLSAGLPPG